MEDSGREVELPAGWIAKGKRLATQVKTDFVEKESHYDSARLLLMSEEAKKTSGAHDAAVAIGAVMSGAAAVDTRITHQDADRFLLDAIRPQRGRRRPRELRWPRLSRRIVAQECS